MKRLLGVEHSVLNDVGGFQDTEKLCLSNSGLVLPYNEKGLVHCLIFFFKT